MSTDPIFARNICRRIRAPSLAVDLYVATEYSGVPVGAFARLALSSILMR